MVYSVVMPRDILILWTPVDSSVLSGTESVDAYINFVTIQ